MSKKKGITWRELSLDQSTVVKALCEPMLNVAVISSAWMPTHGYLPKAVDSVPKPFCVSDSCTSAFSPTLATGFLYFLLQEHPLADYSLPW